MTTYKLFVTLVYASMRCHKRNGHMRKQYDTTADIIKRIFPQTQKQDDTVRLKIDQDSFFFISHKEDAKSITDIIVQQAEILKMDPRTTTITDATAGVGGNVFSFASTFKWVNAIEIDSQRCEYLKNNVDVYGLSNISVYCNDCLKILDKMDGHQIIFFDPPWGGREYKKSANLRLFLGQHSIETTCNKLMDKQIMCHAPKIIAFKLPVNYDIQYFYKTVKSKEIILFNLEKMFVVIVINPNV